MNRPTDPLAATGIMPLLQRETSRRDALAGTLAVVGPLGLRSDGLRGTVARRTLPRGLVEQLRDMPMTSIPVLLDDAIWIFVGGDHSHLIDDANIVASGSVPASRGAWTRLGDHTILSQRSDPGALALPLSDQTDALPRRPEEFGAVGDGAHDDAPAIQAAIDAVEASKRPGVVMLTQGKRYKCGSGLVLNARHVSLAGYAVLDFSSWRGVYIQVTGDAEEFGNSDGYQAVMDGQIIILGQRGIGSNGEIGVGIDFNGLKPSNSAGLALRGVQAIRCGIGYRINSRGYNTELFHCKAGQCDLCFDWPQAAEDNDERVSLFGGTYYNSDRFLHLTRQAAKFLAFGVSIDYTAEVVDIVSGKAHFFGVHCESNAWRDRPFKVNIGDPGQRGEFKWTGGWLVLQGNNAAGMRNVFGIGTNCVVKLEDVTLSHLAVIAPDTLGRRTLAAGPGRFLMRDCEPAVEYYASVDRLHDSSSALADPSFDDPDIQLNPIWRITGTAADGSALPLISRDGSAENNPSIRLHRTTTGQLTGTGALRIDKFGGSGVDAACAWGVPIQRGDKVTSSLFVRRAPDRPGHDGRLVIRAGFAILDGHDQHGIPIVRRFMAQPDAVLVPAPDAYKLVSLSSTASQQTAPSWANAYLVHVIATLASNASFIVDERSMDIF